MAGKLTGLGDNFYVDGFDISGDIGSLESISSSLATIDSTGINSFAHERLATLADGTINFTAYFNVDVGQEHAVLKTLPRTDRHVMYLRATTLGNPGACMVTKQIDYAPKRGTDGSLVENVSAQANSFGLEWGVQLTAGKRTDTTATTPATGVDLTTVSTAFGWQAYAQVFSVVGTSVTLTLADSANNSTFAALTGGAFTAVTAGTRGAQRLAGATNATVRRYVQVQTSGTFTSAVFAVVFVRNITATGGIF